MSFRSVVFPIALALATIVGAADTKPEVKSSDPLGIRAGRTTAVNIFGDNLAPTTVSFAKGGLTAKLLKTVATDGKLKERGNAEVELEITVPEDAAPANYELTLAQAGGVKVVAPISVVHDTVMEVETKKPASDFAHAMLVPGFSVGITGQLDGGNADVFRLESRGGEAWYIDVTAGRAGSKLDPVVRVRDSHRVPMALSAGDKTRDRSLFFRAPLDGTYYIEITDSESRGGAGFTYRLSIRRKQ